MVTHVITNLCGVSIIKLHAPHIAQRNVSEVDGDSFHEGVGSS